MELVEGKIIVTEPSDYESEEIGARLITFLNNWVMSRKLGRITVFSAGFILPNIEEDDSEICAIWDARILDCVIVLPQTFFLKVIGKRSQVGKLHLEHTTTSYPQENTYEKRTKSQIYPTHPRQKEGR